MIDTQPGFSFRHSAECSKTLHGQSLAGCLKVRWSDGTRSWYDDCCEGELVPVAEPAHPAIAAIVDPAQPESAGEA